MEIKKSTVKNVQSNGTWEGKYGVMYKYEIEMTNGDSGQYMSKNQNQDKFKQGMVVDYEFHAGDFPKIKPHFAKTGAAYFGQDYSKNNNTNDKQDTQWQIIRQSSVRTAAEFCSSNCSIEDLIRQADIIAKYCYDGTLPEDELQQNPF